MKGRKMSCALAGTFFIVPGLTRFGAMPMDLSEGEVNVSVRAIENIEREAPSAAAQLGARSGRVEAFEYKAPTCGAAADRAVRPASDGMGCVRGIRIAVAIEAVAWLCLYGLWHLWHILR
jgi:hypothetical protein